MNLEERLDSFIKLGSFMSGIISDNNEYNNDFVPDINKVIKKSYLNNNWFTEDNLIYRIKSLSSSLNSDSLESWMSPYDLKSNLLSNKRVLIVMAGNIPLVGFHDLISTLIVGHHAVVKLSSNDNVLLPYVFNMLCEIDPRWRSRLTYIDNLEQRNFDALITAGSDNSSRYFEYYFRDVPRLIRGNRNSIAVLSGNETDNELDELCKDIFLYFGLGCRSVSKLFLPDGYDTDKLFKAFYKYKYFLDHKKYMSNYDYNKAIFMMEKYDFLENGFCILRKHNSLASPVSVINYEYYNELNDVCNYIDLNYDLLQCVVAKDEIVENYVPFGKSQNPKLWNYANQVDTINFLKSV